MATNTELVIACWLRQDTPEEVIRVLEYMTGGKDKTFKRNPAHALFKTARWAHMLVGGNSGSAATKFHFDNAAKAYYLVVRSIVNNEDAKIEKFLQWIAPYSQTWGNAKSFAGYMCAEELEMEVELIYFEKGRVFLARTDSAEAHPVEEALSQRKKHQDQLMAPLKERVKQLRQTQDSLKPKAESKDKALE